MLGYLHVVSWFEADERHSQIMVATKQADKIKKALTAINITHVISSPNKVFFSKSDEIQFEYKKNYNKIGGKKIGL